MKKVAWRGATFMMRLHLEGELIELPVDTLAELAWIMGMVEHMPTEQLDYRGILSEQTIADVGQWTQWRAYHDGWIHEAHELTNIAGATQFEERLRAFYERSPYPIETYVEYAYIVDGVLYEIQPDMEVWLPWIRHVMERCKTFQQCHAYMTTRLRVSVDEVETLLRHDIEDPLWDMHIAACAESMLSSDEICLQGVL